MNKLSDIQSTHCAFCVVLFISACLIAGCSNHDGRTTGGLDTASPYFCQQPHKLKGSVIGDGHCVALIKYCSGAPNTEQWRPGQNVMSQAPGTIKEGTIIATFLRGRYPNKTGWHAAIYIKHSAQGIWVWDQWKNKPVHKRLIRNRSDRAMPANDAQHYQVVQFVK